MKPIDIEVLMHYHIYGGPHPRDKAPSVHGATIKFLDAGCIEPDHTREHPEGLYKTTAKGHAWVKMLCETPMPVETYKDPRF